MGVLILGGSGVGKSECALELIERGHRLVADDIVILRKFSKEEVVGRSSGLLKYHMEIRGLGILNIERLFGVASVVDEKRVDLIVQLEKWNDNVEYERLGNRRSVLHHSRLRDPHVHRAGATGTQHFDHGGNGGSDATPQESRRQSGPVDGGASDAGHVSPTRRQGDSRHFETSKRVAWFGRGTGCRCDRHRRIRVARICSDGRRPEGHRCTPRLDPCAGGGGREGCSQREDNIGFSPNRKRGRGTSVGKPGGDEIRFENKGGQVCVVAGALHGGPLPRITLEPTGRIGDVQLFEIGQRRYRGKCVAVPSGAGASHCSTM